MTAYMEEQKRKYDAQYDSVRHLLGKHVAVKAYTGTGPKTVKGRATGFVSYEESLDGYRPGVIIEECLQGREYWTDVRSLGQAKVLDDEGGRI